VTGRLIPLSFITVGSDTEKKEVERGGQVWGKVIQNYWVYGTGTNP